MTQAAEAAEGAAEGGSDVPKNDNPKGYIFLNFCESISDFLINY